MRGAGRLQGRDITQGRRGAVTGKSSNHLSSGRPPANNSGLALPTMLSVSMSAFATSLSSSSSSSSLSSLPTRSSVPTPSNTAPVLPATREVLPGEGWNSQNSLLSQCLDSSNELQNCEDKKAWQGCKISHNIASRCLTAFSAYVVPLFNVCFFLERSLNFSNLQPTTPIHCGNPVLRLREAIPKKRHKTADFFRMGGGGGGGAQPHSIDFGGVFPNITEAILVDEINTKVRIYPQK